MSTLEKRRLRENLQKTKRKIREEGKGKETEGEISIIFVLLFVSISFLYRILEKEGQNTK